jgi:DNA-directed RNA polymerase subunit H (RpoH/RPB5)
MLDVYLKSLTDDEKKALSSLNIDVSKLSSSEISKQLESNLSKFISSIKLDDYKISFYVDEKTGKVVKIIIKNSSATGGGVSSRVEITNILAGNDVKFPQISQNMIKQQSSQVDIVGLLKLIENFVVKMQQIK